MSDTPAVESSGDDRERLRDRVRRWTEVQRRLFVERALEALPEEDLVRLLSGLATPEELRRSIASEAEPLPERVRRHVEATRSGAFRGELLVKNDHGQREPWQTDAWVATTWHLFEAAVAACHAGTNAEAAASLRELRDLVHEVDERRDELVTFEDSSAQDEFHVALTRTARHLGAD